jgi:CRISPR-associated protein Cas2
MSRSSSDSGFVVVSYDVKNDRRRVRICKTLKNYGERVQFSVFECCLTPVQLAEMERRVTQLTDDKEDSLRIYRLCAACKAKAVCHGTGKLTCDEEVYVV